ncbi:hypothetical protein [Anaerosinus massiliensis]|uniref:hypothetical protein n=1 Tax=Massilibacillus massiliensis TaxID=1806837 RepID=UPI0018FE7340|nr:hypothetical protein [Massilibacillus massiliensis]
MNSFKDSRGHLWVACSECDRGGNGSANDKCSAGWKHKKFRGEGCFCGDLIEKFKKEAI